MAGWTAEEIVRVLLAAGFVRLPRGATSHVKFRHPDGRTTVVAMHRKDLKAGTLAAIRRESRLPFRR